MRQLDRLGPPVTRTIIVAYVGVFLVSFFARGLHLTELLAFATTTFWLRPWTILTFPFAAAPDPLGVLISGFMLWQFGSDVERRLGGVRYAALVAAVTTATALAVGSGAQLLRTPTVLFGMWLPLSGIMAYWCLRQPQARILLFFVLPMKAIWIFWIDVVLTFFSFGKDHPLLGLFALAGIGVAALWARRGRQPYHVEGGWRRRFERWRASRKIARHGLRIVEDEKDGGNGKGPWVH